MQAPPLRTGGSLSYSSSLVIVSEDSIGPSDGLISPISLKNLETPSRMSEEGIVNGRIIVGISSGLIRE